MANIKAFRKANDLTQDELATYLGTGKSFISLVENGRCALPDAKFSLILNNSQGWDVSMFSLENDDTIPCESSTDKNSIPAEIVEEIKAEAIEEIKAAESVPIVPSDIANTAEINVRKFIEKKADELERISPNDLVQRADGAERVRKTSMMPTFMPGDIVFVEFIDDKTKITDGHIYYFDMKTRPTMIRKVKFEGDKLRLIAENPVFGDIITTFDEILNVADIVGMFRSSFGNQYAEIEAVRRKKDSQIDKLIEQNGEALRSIGNLINLMENKR